MVKTVLCQCITENGFCPSLPGKKMDFASGKNFKNGFENGEKRIIVRDGQRIGFPPGKRCPVRKRIIRPADAAGLIFFSTPGMGDNLTVKVRYRLGSRNC